MKRFVFCLALAIPAPAAAQDPRFEPSPALADCLSQSDAAQGKTAAIDVCVGAEQALQEQRLEDAYDRAFDRLGLWYQVDLHNQQEEWRADLGPRCAAAIGGDPRGNAAGPAYTRCLLDETIARAAWLETYSPE